MMKFAVLVTVIVVLFATSYRDPYITIPENLEIQAGETGHIEVIVEHVQTSMWNLRVYVDADQIEDKFLQRLEISADGEHPILFDEEIPVGTEISVTIDITVAGNSPVGEVKIPVIVAGSKGPCMKGCEPFLVQKSLMLKIMRQEPKLALMMPQTAFEVHSGEIIPVEVQLKNYSAATAYVQKLEAVPDEPLHLQMQTAPSQVRPDVTEPVIMTVFTKDAEPGNYLIHVKLMYRDQIQNTFTESKTVYITILEEEEPPPTPVVSTVPPSPTVNPHNPEEKYLYFVAGMFCGACIFGTALMIGLFLKKRRPTK